MTFPLGSFYHGTKFTMEGISESLHHEMNEIGVKVKIIEPGMIATDFGGVLLIFKLEKFLITNP
jgi:short-subunit dehydrogenase